MVAIYSSFDSSTLYRALVLRAEVITFLRISNQIFDWFLIGRRQMSRVSCVKRASPLHTRYPSRHESLMTKNC
jgi:hypothetical protein